MRDFADILHGSPVADAGQPVLVPGEIELAKMAHHRRHGIPIDAQLLALLHGYAENCAA